MIIGFSHIIVGVAWNGGFQTYYQVPSSPLKWPLMKNQAISHDIVIGVPGMIPFEMVRHNTGLVKSPSRISIGGPSFIKVRTDNLPEELEFFSKFGTQEYGWVHVRSHFRKWCMDIQLDEDRMAPCDPPLDLAGYAALAFYSTDAVNDRSMLIDAGGRMATDIFPMEIGEHNMSVCMMRSPGGTIVELVQVRR